MSTAPGSLFVTGTDTGVGKTLVSAALLRAFARSHHTVVGMKPVAAGLVLHEGAWVSEDAMALRAESNVAVPPELDNPVALHDPLSPHLAAAHAAREITVAELASAHQALSQLADVVVVEGSGGWRVPLNETETLADLAVAIGAPVVLVVGLRLGCLSHALLTAEAVRGDGLALAGWVANCVDPSMPGIDENIEALEARLGAPLLGVGPWSAVPHPRQLSLRLPSPWA